MASETLTVPADQPFWTLDKLLFERLRREVPGLVEKTFARNPGLAALPAFLPPGTRVVVEIPAPPTRLTPRPLINLFSQTS